MKRNIVAAGMLLFFSATLWSCSDSDSPKIETPDQDLEQTLEVKTQTLSEAVNEIAASPGFELITMKETTKEGTEEESDDRFSFSNEITLEDIQGVYDYILPVAEEGSATKMWGLNQAFERVADSSHFVIRLPQEKATRPWKMYVSEDGDAELDNDFVVGASQYSSSTVMSSDGFVFDYLLDADIAIEEEPTGEIFVDWHMDMSDGISFDYLSEFGFENGYSVGHEFTLGDTTEFAYNLKMDGEVLYMEEVEYVRSVGETAAEYEYALTIGNIKIVKNSGGDDYQVYRNDVLEEGAVITVIEDESSDDEGDEGEEGEEEDESDNAFCRGAFDLKITFADETEVVLSELIGDETLSQLDEIFSSMHDMYFVKKLVDVVAREAYNMNKTDNTGE